MEQITDLYVGIYFSHNITGVFIINKFSKNMNSDQPVRLVFRNLYVFILLPHSIRPAIAITNKTK